MRTPNRKSKPAAYAPSRKNFESLEELVDDYIESKRPKAEEELSYYRSRPNLQEAIRVSAQALDSEEKKHDHQWRIPPRLLKELQKGLMKKQEAILASKTFEELLSITECVAGEIWKDAELTIYDTTQRLATYVGIEPRYIYLHAGTRRGARELGLAASSNFLRLEDFPIALRRLRPYELENLLCTGREAFRQLRLKGRTQT